MVQVNDKVFVAPLHGQKGNIAIITGPAGAGAVLNEGNYNTWTKEWIVAIPGNLSSYDEFDMYIDDKNNLIYLAWMDSSYDNRWGVFNIADFSTVFLSTVGSDYTRDSPYLQATHMTLGCAFFESGGISHSIQTYFVLSRDYYTFEVWRTGSKLLTRDVRDDFHTTNCIYFTGGISLTGKYVLFSVRDYDPSPDVYYLMLYKGSYVE